MKESNKILSIVLTLVVVLGGGIYLFFASTNYYAFFLPHVSSPKSMAAFDPRLSGSTTAEKLPLGAIIFASALVLLLIIFLVAILIKHHRQKI